MNKQLNVIILAAGRGSRMNSELPKTLCEINNKPMLFYVLDNVITLNPYKIVIVVGYKKELIIEKVKEYPYKNIEFVEQKETLGTGHAVMVTKDLMYQYGNSTLIFFGDNPCISNLTLNEMVKHHFDNNYDGTLLTYDDEFTHMKRGRIIRENNKIMEIHEDEDELYPSNEYNGGIQIYKNKIMYSALDKINRNNKQNEYYLGDVVKIIVDGGGIIGNIKVDDISELLNVNTQIDLKNATRLITFT